jgi:glycosyltransferase involved in cell wall biosynthesis
MNLSIIIYLSIDRSFLLREKRMSKIKVLYIINQLGIGGTENHLIQLSNLLDKNKYDVYLYVMKGSEVQNSKYLEKEVTIITGTRSTNTITNLVFNFTKLIHTINKIKPDITHYFLPEAYLVGGICSLLFSRSKRIMSRRCLNNYQDKYMLLKKVEYWLHTKIDFMLGNSCSVIEQLKEEYVPDNKIGLIYNGVVLSDKATQEVKVIKRDKLFISQDCLVIVVVANLMTYKGHMDLLSALAIIKEKVNQDWQVLCVGRDDGYGLELRGKARELDLLDNVRWFGPHNDVSDFFDVADIGLLCSHEEGFSNSILEMMSSGLPVIATAVGGNPEAVINNLTGILVEPQKANQISDAILLLANDKELREKMGKNGRISVEEKFSWNRCIEQYDGTYNRLLGL